MSFVHSLLGGKGSVETSSLSNIQISSQYQSNPFKRQCNGTSTSDGLNQSHAFEFIPTMIRQTMFGLSTNNMTKHQVFGKTVFMTKAIKIDVAVLKLGLRFNCGKCEAK